jgi:Tfp pilus assembly protein PilV
MTAMTHDTASRKSIAPSGVRTRRGISLLEVIITMVILLSSVMVLSRLAFLSQRHAIGGEDRTKAQMLCTNLMSEITCGSRPLENSSPQVFEGDLWMYSVDVEQVGMMPLAKVTVKVFRLAEDREGVSSDIPADDEIPTYELVQWLRAPGDQFDGGLESAAGMAEPDSMGAMQ